VEVRPGPGRGCGVSGASRLWLIGDVSTAEAGERYFQSLGRRERGSALYHVVTASVLAKA
jgi:hypothetical protein